MGGDRRFSVYVDEMYFVEGIPTGHFTPPKKERTGLTEFIAIRERVQRSTSKKEPRLNKPQFIVIHCSDSAWGTAREIRKWHLERGFADIGYHYVILNGQLSPSFELPPLNGSIEVARWWEEDGAHCVGYNTRSISICGIAKETWTPQQEASLIHLTKTLLKQFNLPVKSVLGHGETESGKKEGKTCPNLDMDKIRKALLQ